jgi:DUF4097 and DUF4098 domain-containing protein YvlB
MKKQDFINELNNGLANVPTHIRDEIIADINEHFTEGFAHGMSEEEVCDNLGHPSTIAAQVLEEYGETVHNHYEQGQPGRNMDRDFYREQREQEREQHRKQREQQREQHKNQREQQREQHREQREQQRDHHHKQRDLHHEIEAEFNYQKDNTGNEIDMDETFSGIQNIYVKMTDAKIRYKPSTDGNCRVTVKGHAKNDNILVYEKDGTLILTDNEPKFRFRFIHFKSSLVVTVYIPSQFWGEIKTLSTHGNISAGGISGRLYFKATAGNITVEDHRGSEIRLYSSAGNITLHTEEGRVENTDISTAAGSVKITARETGRLSINSAAGSVVAEIIRLTGDAKINSAAGSVKFTAHETEGNINISTAAGSAKIYLPKNVNCHFDVKKPVMGSIRNELTGNPQSPYVLKVRGSMGSIHLAAL